MMREAKRVFSYGISDHVDFQCQGILVGKGSIEGVGNDVMCHNKPLCVGVAKVKIVEVVHLTARLPYPHSFSKVLSDSLDFFEEWNICDLSSNTNLEKHKVLLSLFFFFLN